MEDQLKEARHADRVVSEGALPPTLQAIPEAAADPEKAKRDADKAADEARRRAEQLASQEQQRILAQAELRNQLNQVGFEKTKELNEEALDFAKRMIDAEFDYREARANRFGKMQADIERRLAAQRQSIADAFNRYQTSILESQARTAAAQAKATAAAQADAIMPAVAPAASAGGAGTSGDSISIVEFGKALQKMGFRVREHPAFGGVGRHSRNSYHYSGEALDITDWRSGDWRGRTKQLGEALRRSGAATEVFHPGYDPVGGHESHLHAAFRGGRVPLTPGMRQLLGGQISSAAPVSGTAFSIEKREEAAKRDLQVAQAQSAADLEVAQKKLLNDLLKVEADQKVLIAQAMERALPMEEQRLENMLSETRLAAQLQGLSDSQVDLLVKQTEAMMAANAVQAAFQTGIKKLEEEQQGYNAQLAAGTMNQAVHAAFTDLTSRRIAELRSNIAKINTDLPIYNQGIERAALATEAARPRLALVTALKEAKDAIKDLGTPAFQLIEVAQGVSTAFGDAFRGIISGASSAKEVLAGFFKTIGDTFAEMIARLITESVRANILQGVGNIFGLFGQQGFGPGYFDPKTGLGKAGPNFGLANGGIIQGNFMPVRAFATGGIVKGPTMGLVGEGRYNEAVVPLPDGKSIPVQLGNGAGSNVSTNIVVNVNNGQAQSQTTGQGGQALARELEGAVRQVILKESRPGGIIYSTNR
ncbi:MAG: hypothetical protein ACO3X1_11405 [Burkholderiaceae bacterium]